MNTSAKLSELHRQLYIYVRAALTLLLVAVVAMGSLSSCVDEEYPSSDTPEGNFEALWRIMDEHYCFFPLKAEVLGVDWDEVHTRYRAMIRPDMTDDALFQVLCNMLSELRDGHVNLWRSSTYGHDWSYREPYPKNFSADLVDDYLGTGNDYSVSSGMSYRVLDDNVGYLRVASFENGLGEGNISDVLYSLRMCRGLIIDVRDNGGGQLTASRRLASSFINERTLCGYTQHKTGSGHYSFSSPSAEWVDPADGYRWQKPAVVLTNRGCYSATNDFVNVMRHAPLVTLLGDTTGGGSGLPFTSELPNGWGVRYSASITLDADRQHIEFGIAPDTVVSLDSLDLKKHRDTLIEAARKHIHQAAASSFAMPTSTR
jgi:hypothetical protein